MSRYFITGGAGFIGTALARRLVRDDSAFIAVFDNLSRNSLVHHPSLLASNRLKLIVGDVCDRSALSAAIVESSPDFVLHLASVAGVATVESAPVETSRVSLLGTLNVLEEAAANTDARLLIDFSTSEVYGNGTNLREDQPTVVLPVGKARWCYAASKLAAEHLVRACNGVGGMSTCTIRPFNIYGPGQVGGGAVRSFVKGALREKPIFLYGGGGQTRDWCYIDDMVDATIAILESPDLAASRTINVGNGKLANCLTVRRLAEVIIELVGSRSTLFDAPPQDADIDTRAPCIDEARSLFGYEPKVDIVDGLKRTLGWYREHPDA